MAPPMVTPSSPPPLPVEPSSTSLTPVQQRLPDAEQTYLNGKLPEFIEYSTKLAARGTGPRGVGNVKGMKLEWIKQNVFPGFVEQFGKDPDKDCKLHRVRSLNHKWPCLSCSSRA